MAESDPHAQKIIPQPYQGVLAEPWSLGKLWRMFASFGPAAIVASLAIGAGETIVVVRAGSWAGYDLLWLVLLSVLTKGLFVTYLLGRYTAMSGEPIGQRLARLPGPRGWLLITLVVLEMIAAGPLWAAIARPCGDLLHHLLFTGSSVANAGLWSEPLIERLLTTLFVAAALGLSMLLTFERLERQQVLICLILVVGTTIGTLIVRPDFAAALKGSFAFGHVPEIPPWAPEGVRTQPLLNLATVFGYVGGSVLGYVVYANWISLHGWGLTSHPQIDEIRRRAAKGRPADYLPDDPAQIARIRRSVRPLKWDVGCGAIVLWVVSASFMMAGAAVLYPLLQAGKLDAAFAGWSLLTDQAHIWSNIHPSLTWVYYLCVLIALWGTLQAFPEVYSRVIVDFGRSIRPGWSWTRRRVQAVVSLYVFGSCSLIVWSDLQFDMLIHVVAFLTTNMAIAIAMLAALYLNFQLPPAYRTRWWMLVGGVASVILLTIATLCSGYGLWEELRQAYSASASAAL